MKILLANPPTRDNKLFIREGRCNQEQGAWTTLWPPVSLATAGAVLENQGHSVDIIDCPAQGVDYSTFLGKIASRKYEFACWSTATPSISSDLSLSEKIKTIDPDLKTAVFGTHVTELTDDCFQKAPCLDFIIRNEPEETLSDLAACLAGKKEPSVVFGLSFRQGEKIIHNPVRPYIGNLDLLPFPAWHLMDLDCYRLPLSRQKFLIISPIRGCPYPCTFCTARTYYGAKIRKKSVGRVMDEINYIVNRFGVRNFLIWADTFTADRDYVGAFCESIVRQGLAVSWACNSRVDTVDDALLKQMASAGCWMISYGIESGDPHVLKTVKKNITLNQAHEAVSMAKKNGISVAGHFILGLPGDSTESINKTIAFARSLNLDFAQFYCATPFPGSPLFQTAKDNQWIKNLNFESFRQDNAVMALPGLVPETVNRLRKKAYRSFYMSPKNLLNITMRIHTGSIKDMIQSGLKFLKWSRS